MYFFHFLIATIAPLALGWFLDYLTGDPEKLPHPVVWMGKWIAFGEKRLNNGENRVTKGALFAIGSIVMAYLLTNSLFAILGLMMFITSVPYLQFSIVSFNIIYTTLSAIVIFYCLAGHTLRKEVCMVFEAVDESLEKGRKQVARIVGRDTSELSAQEVRTAALETLAENLSDGVVAPIFWYILLGVPGMVAYKMVNTLDSMIGYQNERYKDFGRWAAKIDDVANFIPARITAMLILIAVHIYKKMGNRSVQSTSFKEGFAFVRQFGPQHASPNSGWPEAALAYTLNCRFGGPHNYFGEYFYKPFIGTNPRPLNTNDMHISIGVCLGAELIMVFIALALQSIPTLMYLACF